MKMPTAQSQSKIRQAYDWVNNRLDAAHNHSSCDLEPSKGDFDFTHRLADFSGIAQIRLLDHLIVTTTRETSKSYSSIREPQQELFQ